MQIWPLATAGGQWSWPTLHSPQLVVHLLYNKQCTNPQPIKSVDSKSTTSCPTKVRKKMKAHNKYTTYQLVVRIVVQQIHKKIIIVRDTSL